MILFDTDICIEILRGNSSLIEHRRSIDSDVAVSFMTVAELFYGVHKSSNVAGNQSVVEAFLITVHVIESDRQICRRFGELKAGLAERGTIVADADLLIAATALERCRSLVTGNVRHFEMIEGLQVSNWRTRN